MIEGFYSRIIVRWEVREQEHGDLTANLLQHSVMFK